MFRSLIEEKIRFWHVWMDTIYPVLLWPSSVLLGVAAGPPCPLGCVRSAWKQQIRRSLGAEHLGSSAGGLGLCAGGNPMGMKSCCVPDRASVQGENIQEGAFPPCALRTASLLSMEGGYHPSSTDAGWYSQARWCAWQQAEDLLAAEITFQEVPFWDFIFLFGECWSYANPWRKQPWTHSSWNEEKWALS